MRKISDIKKYYKSLRECVLFLFLTRVKLKIKPGIMK